MWKRRTFLQPQSQWLKRKTSGKLEILKGSPRRRKALTSWRSESRSSPQEENQKKKKVERRRKTKIRLQQKILIQRWRRRRAQRWAVKKKSVDRDLHPLPSSSNPIRDQTLPSQNLLQQNHQELSLRSRRKEIQQGRPELRLQNPWQVPLRGRSREALSEQTMKTTSPKQALECLQLSQIKMNPRPTMQRMTVILKSLRELHQQDRHNRQPQGNQNHLEKILEAFRGRPHLQLPKPPQEVPQQNPMHHSR